jgi:GT2 family glycosyltransferase
MDSQLATAQLAGADAGAGTAPQPALSVVIKALNEAGKIEACLRSVIAATDPATTEIIVADSLSEDATVALASRFPVKVVQLARIEDRGCGAGGQLGFQYARGKRLLMIDGDMELAPDFLAAGNAALDADPKLAGVAGLVVERVMTLEFQRRHQKPALTATPGLLNHLACGGLYRMDAIQPLGYFTDRNLHAFEEFDLGLRLTAAGWRMRRLGQPGFYHYGHATAAFPLLLKRWKTRYLHGHGELLRSKWGTEFWWRCLLGASLSISVFVWWATLACFLAAHSSRLGPRSAARALRRRRWSLRSCCNASITRQASAWRFYFGRSLTTSNAAGLVAGLLAPQPSIRGSALDSVVRHSRSLSCRRSARRKIATLQTVGTSLAAPDRVRRRRSGTVPSPPRAADSGRRSRPPAGLPLRARRLFPWSMDAGFRIGEGDEAPHSRPAGFRANPGAFSGRDRQWAACYIVAH